MYRRTMQKNIERDRQREISTASGPKERKNGEKSKRSTVEEEQRCTMAYQKRPLFIKLCLGRIEGFNLPSGFLAVLLQD